jgi:hypothetical protein
MTEDVNTGAGKERSRSHEVVVWNMEFLVCTKSNNKFNCNACQAIQLIWALRYQKAQIIHRQYQSPPLDTILSQLHSPPISSPAPRVSYASSVYHSFRVTAPRRFPHENRVFFLCISHPRYMLSPQ